MRTLVSYLNERTPQELRNIAESWQINLSGPLYAGNAFELAEQMIGEFRQRRMLEQLTPPMLQLFEFFLKQSNSTATLQQAADKLKKELKIITTIAVKLRELGLLYPERTSPFDSLPRFTEIYNRVSNRARPTQNPDELAIPRELSRPLLRLVNEKLAADNATGEVKSGFKITQLPLVNLLQRLETERLSAEADTWGLYGLRAEAKATEIAEELARSMSDSYQQKRVLDLLSPDCRELFEQLKAEPHPVTIDKLLEKYVSHRRLSRAIEPLTEASLVWEVFENKQSLVWVPAEIKTPKTDGANRPNLDLQTVPEPADALHIPPFALAWDILTFLNYLNQNEVVLTQQEEIPKRHLKKIAPKLWYKEDVEELSRFGILTELCQKLKLIEYDLEERRIIPGETSQEWLKLDLYEQSRRLFKLYRDNPSSYSTIYFPFYYAGRDSYTKVIDSLLSWLVSCQPHVWYSLDSLLLKVEKEQPYFIRSRRELLNTFGTQRLQDMSKQWRQVEGSIIRTIIGTVMEWFGLVRVGRDNLKRVTSFSLTDFGLELAQRSDTPTALPVADKPLTVLANFEVMLFVPQTNVLWNLLQFADPVKLDNVSQFVINQKSVLRGMDTGVSPSQVIALLKEKSAQPVPQNLLVSIEDWGKDYKLVQVRRTVLLQVENPAILDELLQSKQYASFIQERLTPNAALVQLPEHDEFSRVDPLKSFKGKLKTGGYFTR